MNAIIDVAIADADLKDILNEFGAVEILQDIYYNASVAIVREVAFKTLISLSESVIHPHIREFCKDGDIRTFLPELCHQTQCVNG